MNSASVPFELSSLALCGGQVVTPYGIIEPGVVLLDGGRITAVGRLDAIPLPSSARVIDTNGCVVLPGFIDTHVHGCGGDDVMTAGAAGVARMARNLCRYGVTAFLPTTITSSRDAILDAIRACREAGERQGNPGSGEQGAVVLGMHIEGPFINLVRKGAQPVDGIRDPDLEECREYLSAAPGFIRVMTLAPELPGAEDLIRLLCDHAVMPSMGHTDADYGTALRAIGLGAKHATHLFNQMPPIHHRAPGAAVACLNDPGVTVELITDGVHLDAGAVTLALRCKGRDRVALITDAISALGMAEGAYQFGGREVRVSDGRCTLPDGTLAGSVHQMDRAVFNTMKFSGCSLEDASRMASGVPAEVAGAAGRKGSLEVGKDADIVALRNGEVQWTMVKGEVVYNGKN